MKTSDRLATILFPAERRRAAFGVENNYDLPVCRPAASSYLPAAGRGGGRVPAFGARAACADAVTADFGGIFRFDGQLTPTAAVLGGFLPLAAAALRLVSGGMAGLS